MSAILFFYVCLGTLILLVAFKAFEMQRGKVFFRGARRAIDHACQRAVMHIFRTLRRSVRRTLRSVIALAHYLVYRAGTNIRTALERLLETWLDDLRKRPVHTRTSNSRFLNDITKHKNGLRSNGSE